ncbi:MAG: efflux RND transporter periplasmic adaptor subunit [Elusimicrobiales bacterium]
MKKIFFLIIIAALAGGGYWYYAKANRGKKQHYGSAVAEKGNITETVETTGNVEPLNRVQVNSPVGGRVDRLLAEEGDKVKRGQILAYLSSTERVAILDAARASGEAEISKWEDTYKPTPVLSPLDGTVILRNVVQGQTIDTNTSLYALSDDLIVVAQVDESDIGRLKTGQRADITLDAYPGKKVHGLIFQILQEGKNVSNVITYNAKIRPDAVPPFFKSGMTANIKIMVNRKNGVIILPAIAISEDQDGSKTVLKGTPENPVPAPVKTGIEDGSNVEIVSGAEEGEKVFYRSSHIQQSAGASTNPFMPARPAQQGNKTANRAARRFM